jgi:FKBP-type peptidyl-prolyl cis-trans isomerase SlyD
MKNKRHEFFKMNVFLITLPKKKKQPMNISPNTVVSLTYELRIGNAEGDLVERVEEEQPFVFLFGTGNMLPDFEGNLTGKEAGNGFEFIITAQNGYGDYALDAIIQVPRHIFETDNGTNPADILFEGNYLTLVDQDGNPMRGKVMEATAETVKMDFNHPLAGKDLHFTGEILSIRNATEEELAHGHVHGPGGHHH